ncbi:MAG: ATP-dependent DNA helicase [Bacteroidota bacterium]
MLKNHINSILIKSLEHSPTATQEKLLSKLASFISSNKKDEVFLMKGYAGTGKTTTVKTLINTLKSYRIKSVLLAPTGRAAKVLAGYTGQSAYTIHKKIYRQRSSKDGFGDFVLEKNLHKNTYFIVDEASMISNQSSDFATFGSGSLLDDLIQYVYEGYGCKLVLIGDTAQLPPVKMDLSPALEAQNIEGYGLSVVEAYLTDVLRQSQNSGILANATRLRELLLKDVNDFPQISVENFSDIEYLSGADLVETITDTYDAIGMEETVIVTRSNKRANQFNQGIRNQILWREEELSAGDYLMIVKNNYYWTAEEDDMDFIANGDVAEVLSVQGYQELYGYRFADVVLRFIDYNDLELEVKILIDTLHSNSASLTRDENKALFYNVMEDYQDVKGKKARYQKVKDNPYFNALQVKFSYAVTCHKAQGGQWRTVFVDHGYLTEEMINKEFIRWLYTAFTRAADKLYLINFHKSFFPE